MVRPELGALERMDPPLPTLKASYIVTRTELISLANFLYFKRQSVWREASIFADVLACESKGPSPYKVS